jgi:hypothetical protein
MLGLKKDARFEMPDASNKQTKKLTEHTARLIYHRGKRGKAENGMQLSIINIFT